jgi:hypothetical protein
MAVHISCDRCEHMRKVEESPDSSLENLMRLVNGLPIPAGWRVVPLPRATRSNEPLKETLLCSSCLIKLHEWLTRSPLAASQKEG